MISIIETACQEWNSPIGVLRVFASSDALTRITFGQESESLPPLRSNPVLDLGLGELQLYFEGKIREFSVPFEVSGTPFQRLAWKALQSIPYGETCSYRDQAARIGAPRALRAIGNANRRNPLPIIIPCHRVIRSTGEAGGYAGKTGSAAAAKIRLLRLEQGHLI